MEGYYNFESIRDELTSAVEAVAERHDLELAHPLLLAAVLEVIASPLKLHKLQGTPLTRPVGTAGIDAYLTSLLARRVEEIKAPGSLIVNPLMDAAVATLRDGRVLDRSDLLYQTCRALLDNVTSTSSDVISATRMAQEQRTQSAFESALRYLKEAEIIIEQPGTREPRYELAPGLS